MPIYFKVLSAVPPLEILAHRVIWAMGLLLLLARQQKALGQVARRSGPRGRWPCWPRRPP